MFWDQISIDVVNFKHLVIFVGIKPLKVKHNVTKLNLIVHLLSFWYIDIDLSIQLMSLTLYIT